MPRPGGNPDIVKAGRKTRFNGNTAAINGRKSVQAKTVYKSLTADLKERLTADRVAKANDRLISMMEHGNLHAYEIVRDMLGENPKNGVIDTEMLNRAREILEGVDSVID